MATINEIRLKIQELYHDNPDIHIDVSMNRPRIHIVNQEATIKGVYKNVFQIKTGGECHTLQYSDILIKRIRIAEF